MADAAPAAQSAPDTGRVAVYDADGNLGTVPADQVPVVLKHYGRVATTDEIDAAREKAAADAASAEYASRSTTEKIVGGAALAGPVGTLGYLAYTGIAGHTPALPPMVESYRRGVGNTFTGGLATAAEKKLNEAAGGKEAAQRYEQYGEQAQAGHGTAYTAGQVAGFAGGMLAGNETGLARAGNPIAGAGSLAEEAVASRLAGLASRGVAGKAAASALSLGIRGATEGAIYSAANQVSEAQLGDHELAADKFFANTGLGALYGGLGGAALGGAGSLLKSGVSAALASRSESGLARAASKAEEAGAAAESKATEGAAEAPRMKVEAPAGAQGVASDQAWKATGAIKKYATQAEKAFGKDGTKIVGKELLAEGVIDTNAGVVQALKNASPEAMAEHTAQAFDTVSTKLGDMTSASPARIDIKKVGALVDDVAGPLSKKAGFESIEKGVRDYGDSLLQKLQATADEKGTVSLQDVLSQRKSLDDLVYREGSTAAPSPRVQELRNIRRGLEDLVARELDAASGKIPGAQRAEYEALKQKYIALKIAKNATADAVAGSATRASFGLGDKAAAGIGAVIGHVLPGGSLVAAPAAAVASKFLRERGNAAAAVLLYKAANLGVVNRAVSAFDNTVARASKGLLEEPKAVPLPRGSTSSVPPRVKAQEVMQRVAQVQANPEAFAEHVSRSTEPLAQTAPNVANALGQRLTNAAAFLASKIPVKADKDPFDPHPAPKLSDSQAASFVKYAEYADRPAKFYEEAEHGKLTYEGVETAKALTPKAFYEFRQKVTEQMMQMMADGKTIPFRQRERLGVLLDVAATPSQRPDHMQLLQANVVGSDKAGKKTGPDVQPKTRPLTLSTQQSKWDRIEGGSGSVRR